MLCDLRSHRRYSYASHYAGSGTDGTIYVTDKGGNPNVFNLNRNGDELWLNGNNAKPSNRWNANNKFVFRTRKSILFP